MKNCIRVALASASATLLSACNMVAASGIAFDGEAVRGDDPAVADVRPSSMTAYVLYKSARCPNPGADSCLDDVAVGHMLSDPAHDYEHRPLEGTDFPVSFSRAMERSYLNVQFESDVHPGARWSFGIVMLAPMQEDNDIDASLLEAMADDTPVAMGSLLVETQDMPADTLEQLGLSAPDEDGRSFTFVEMPTEMIACQRETPDADCGPFTAIEKGASHAFTIETLGAVRERLVFPHIAANEVLRPL